MTLREIYAIGSVLIAILLALPAVSASGDSLSNLKSLVSGFDDPRMSVSDLAFFLATHGFDASPRGSYVEVDLGDRLFRLTPNGPALGLCAIAS